MTTDTTRNSHMVLFSAKQSIHSHSCRIVVYEKEVDCYIQYVTTDSDHEELAELNPYNETPTLVDRELVLFEARIINEYLDERLPHPPLMPVDPVSRGRARLYIERVQRDWLNDLKNINDPKSLTSTMRQNIRDGLLAISPAFNEQTYMLGEDYTLVDCYMAPLLWRLPWLGIELPKQAQPILDYADRLFDRPAFSSSLSDIEREIRLS